MTSLPIPTSWSEQTRLPPATSKIGPTNVIGQTNLEDEQFLLRAFRSFAEAADSLEQSYGRLRTEVAGLRRELEKSNSDLSASLEENRGMRTHLNLILEGLPCGVVVVDHNDQICRANPEALRLLGLEPQPDAPALTSVAQLPAAIRQLLACARNQGGDAELSISGDENAARWLAARHASIADHATSASIFILRDVSERKRLEETQAQLRREQALAEIASVLAHEIRNPLGSLELFAGLLAEANLDRECREWVGHVQAGLRTLAATVNNVLHFHSLPEPERMPVDLGQLLVWARDFFIPLARQSHITLSLQNRVSGIFFPADRHRLEQVLLNLVLNAIGAMPGGGWIELAGRIIKTANCQTVELAVTDTGRGISPEDLPRIFEPGFSTRVGSPGLGLAVCRKIAQQHGGTIRAASLPGRGARFSLTFPLVSESAGSQSAGEIE